MSQVQLGGANQLSLNPGLPKLLLTQGQSAMLDDALMAEPAGDCGVQLHLADAVAT